MASSPESKLRDEGDFRAPPPSPVAGSRRPSSVANDQVLTDFLDNNLRIPDLVLFPRLVPYPSSVGDMVVPTVDFRYLSLQTEVERDALQRFGCFQLLYHGVSSEMLQAALISAAGIFRLSLETKNKILRSDPDNRGGFGFEEDDYYHDLNINHNVSLCEDFIWCNDSGLRFKMEQIWPNGYSNLREQMERVSSAIEEVSRGVLEAIMKTDGLAETGRERLNQWSSSVCHIYKHPMDIPIDSCINSFRYHVIRMMVRGTDFPHTLTLHVCGEPCSDFHVYSKKGWLSFTPSPNALVITAGDQLQVWSGGKYKHVIGRPIYKGGQQGNSISMAFLCSPSSSSSTPFKHTVEVEKKIITLYQQAFFAVLFTIACQFVLFIYHKF